MELKLEPITKLCGYLLTDSNANAINTIIIVAKSFVFRCSRFNMPLNLARFQYILNKVYLEQEMLSKINATNERFQKRWYRFLPLFL